MDRQAVVRHAPPHVVANVALIAVAALAAGWLMIGLPLALNTASWPPVLACVTAVPVVLATPIHWGLIHEGIHGQLLPSRRANEWVARALAIVLGLPFDAVRFGHLMHHRFTREPYDRPDVSDLSPTRSQTWPRVAYYARLLGGLYVAEWVIPLLAFVPASVAAAIVARGVGNEGPVGPQVQRLFARHAADPERRRRTRRDWLLSLALYAFALHLYGPWWPVLIVSMWLRGLWLSVADNLPHYRVSLDEPGRARDFRVPPGVGVLLMNHHLHRQHHLQPTLPWIALAHAPRAATSAARPGYFRAAWRQFGGVTRTTTDRT
ncbi:MAG TPA: fatty acid desaturase [Paraburkholderia sp.]|jgi:fatty acid desaturase|nr:fatty acid desaturase [Paraburkholderia sp.]